MVLVFRALDWFAGITVANIRAQKSNIW